MENMRQILSVFGIVLLAGIVALVIWLIARPKKELPAKTGRTDSYFDGTTLQWLGMRLLAFLLTAITLGFGYPWAICMLTRWETKHTVINGRRLKFTGKGLQLIGKYLLWWLLTIITFGIYGIWFSLHVKKWLVKHTVYADGETNEDSRFTGGVWGFLGIHLLQWLIIAITFGIGAPWAEKKVMQWEAKHTHIGGSALYFSGTGGQLFVKYLLLGLLTPLTLGIYAIFFPVKYLKWQWSHTDAVYQLPHIKAKSREHEAAVLKDYAQFQIAAKDTEIAILKSGLTGEETQEQLRELAHSGNPFAAYRLAVQLKEESSAFRGEALDLLRQASQAGYYQAMQEYASLDRDASLWEMAAAKGSGEAAWKLKQYYEGKYKSTDNLRKTAYWFYMAQQWNVPEAVAAQEEYQLLIRDLAIAIAKYSALNKGTSVGTVIAVIAGVIAAILLAGGIAALAETRLDIEELIPEFQWEQDSPDIGGSLLELWGDDMENEIQIGTGPDDLYQVQISTTPDGSVQIQISGEEGETTPPDDSEDETVQVNPSTMVMDGEWIWVKLPKEELDPSAMGHNQYADCGWITFNADGTCSWAAVRFADSVNSGWYWLGGSEEYRSGTYTYDGNTLTVSAGFYEITIDVASDGTSGVVSSSSWSDLILFQMIDGQYAEVEIIAYLSENY